MASLTANEVAQMQSDLDVALAQMHSLENSLAIMTNERDMIRSALTKAQSERDYWLVRATEQTAILEGTAATLVAGIERQRNAARARQEETLDVGRDTPAFLKTPRQPPGAIFRASQRAFEADRREREPVETAGAVTERLLAPLAETRPAPENAPVTPAAAPSPRQKTPGLGGRVIGAVVRDDIVDPRLPSADFGGETDDDRALRDLANNIGARAG